MTNYYNSGLYMESFFTKHKHLGLDYDYLLDEMLGCNYHLFLKHYSDDLDYKNDDDLKEQISNLFLENIDYYPTYFQPLIFNEEIALECSLTPFTHYELNLLALSGCGMDFSPRLDTYQALTDHTIDERSCLFLDFNYFEYVVGKNLTQKVLEAIDHAQ